MKFGCAIYVFLNSENLTSRITDILKYFKGSLQLRDNKSRLYLNMEDRLWDLGGPEICDFFLAWNVTLCKYFEWENETHYAKMLVETWKRIK